MRSTFIFSGMKLIAFSVLNNTLHWKFTAFDLFDLFVSVWDFRCITIWKRKLLSCLLIHQQSQLSCSIFWVVVSNVYILFIKQPHEIYDTWKRWKPMKTSALNGCIFSHQFYVCKSWINLTAAMISRISNSPRTAFMPLAGNVYVSISCDRIQLRLSLTKIFHYHI